MGRRYPGERIRQRVPESIGAGSGHRCFGTFIAAPRSCGGAIAIAYTLSAFSRLTKHSMALPGAPERALAGRLYIWRILLDSWGSILRAIKERAFTIPYLRYSELLFVYTTFAWTVVPCELLASAQHGIGHRAPTKHWVWRC